MFGTLKPHTCKLGCDSKADYETFYCGLCKSLGDHFGTLTRALLNYDAVFLALVADGLMETPAAPDRCRCPMLPVTFRPTVRPDSPAMRYAAAMQMLLSDQWLADRAEGGKRSASAARPVLSGKVGAARAILAELGVSLADLEGFEKQQARREVPGVTGPRAAAEPTAGALARVFERMADLPGVIPEARSEQGRAALAAFGRHLGSAIYLIDALDDLEKDHRGGDFNPCLARSPRDPESRVSWPRVEVAWSLLHDDLAALDALSTSLPLLRHRDLIRSVVAVEMRRLARDAAARAHAYARAQDAARRAAHRSTPARVLAAVAAAFVFAWVWLASLPAFARNPPPKRPINVRDAGAQDAGPDAGDAGPDAGRDAGSHGVPPIWEPKLPPTAPTSTGGSASPTEREPRPGGAKPPEKPADKPAPAKPGGGSGCGNPCSGCKSPCDGSNPCQGCGDSCSKIGKGCTDGCGCDCCQKCNDCNSCCKSCGDCKGCNDCGNCCKGCNGCGSCCDGCNGCNNCGNCGSCCR